MTGKTLQPKSLLDFKNIKDVKVSPDGQKIIYTVQEQSLEDDRSHSALWLIRGNRSAETLRLTNGSNDSGPAWSPDSQTIAFTSGREKRNQLYLINVDGGEARQLKTDVFPTSLPQWSADGQHLAFLAPVDVKVDQPRYPGEPPELLPQQQDSQRKEDKKTTEAVRVITDFHYRADGVGFVYHQYKQLFVVSPADDCCRQLTNRQERINDFTWHPSGRSLAYTVQNFDLNRVRYTTTVREVDLDGKGCTTLLEFDGSVMNLSYSPDGQWLLLTANGNDVPYGTATSSIWAAHVHGASLPLAAPELNCLTSGLNRSCRQVRWDKSGHWIYFLKEEAGRQQLHRFAFDSKVTGEIEHLPLNGLSNVSAFEVAGDGTIVYAADDFTHAPQIYLTDNGQTTQLTHLNAELLADCPICAAEKFSYHGPDDWEIDGWVVKPKGYQEGRRYPTILNVHGGPTGAYLDSFNLQFQLLSHQGYAVVFTNPRGSTGYGTEFTQGCVKDWGGKDYLDIMAGLDAAIDMGIVDPNRVGIMGWSYGGYMTCWTVTQTNRFKAAVGGANISNIYTLYGCSDIGAAYDEGLLGGPAFDDEELYMGRSAIHHVRNVTTPILLLHGEADIRCPIDQSEQYYTALKRLGKEVVFVRYPEQYHGFTKPSYIYDRWTRTIAWFDHYLRG